MKANRPVPLCRKCREKHFNVVTCERHAAKIEYDEDHRVVPRWRSDGPRKFGDNLPSFNKQGSTLWRKRESK